MDVCGEVDNNTSNFEGVIVNIKKNAFSSPDYILPVAAAVDEEEEEESKDEERKG